MLRQRFITVVALLIPLIAVVFLLPRMAAVLLLAALVLGGAWEWSQFLVTKSMQGRVLFTVVTAVLLGVAWWASAEPAALTTILWASAIWWLLALAWITRWPTPVPRGVAALVGFVVLVPAWLALARLHYVAPRGPELLILMFAVVWAADTGAYFSGRMFGRVKLAPRVSPGKTWEGVLGGLVAALLVAVVAGFVFPYPLVGLGALCLAVALVSIVGDLTVSMFKRHSGLKDSGKLFPGHGGILDRIDSIAAGAPVFVLGMGWLGTRL